jgi:hypothetical protein
MQALGLLSDIKEERICKEKLQNSTIKRKHSGSILGTPPKHRNIESLAYINHQLTLFVR